MSVKSTSLGPSRSPPAILVFVDVEPELDRWRGPVEDPHTLGSHFRSNRGWAWFHTIHVHSWLSWLGRSTFYLGRSTFYFFRKDGQLTASLFDRTMLRTLVPYTNPRQADSPEYGFCFSGESFSSLAFAAAQRI